jgi:hypothetical protein
MAFAGSDSPLADGINAESTGGVQPARISRPAKIRIRRNTVLLLIGGHSHGGLRRGWLAA